MTMENDSPNWGDVAAGWEIVTLYRVGYGVSWVTDLAGLQPELARLLDTDGAVIWSVEPVGALRKREATKDSRIQTLEAELARKTEALRQAEQALMVTQVSIDEDTTALNDTLWIPERFGPNESLLDFVGAARARIASALEEKTDV